jgi:methionyl-tRNA formyltransferase
MVDALRVVFFGTPAFAVPTLDALLASRHQVVAVVTQPDRPRGRGQRTTDTPVKAHARLAALPILQPPALKDPGFVSALTNLHADLGVVAAYGKILTEAVLAAPRLGMVNVHASLLPRYRGAAPVQRAIMAGERETGVTIMRIVKALDAGPMLATVRRTIAHDDTSEDVERALATLGAALLVSTLDEFAAGTLPETPQDDSLATYAARLTRADGMVDWTQWAADVHNRIRGLHPWPHAHTFVNGKRLILLRSALGDGPAVADQGNTTPGTIVCASGDDLCVACGQGVIRIVQLQTEGTRPMSARDFLAGHRLAAGERLTSGP